MTLLHVNSKYEFFMYSNFINQEESSSVSDTVEQLLEMFTI